MIKNSDRIILEEFAGQVKKKYPQARVWAFGSRARGQAGPDADFDICVVIGDGSKRSKSDIQDMAWEISFRHGIVIMVLVFTEDEFTKSPRAASPLIKTILSEGVPA